VTAGTAASAPAGTAASGPAGPAASGPVIGSAPGPGRARRGRSLWWPADRA
jgi:hypothetical protein